VELAVLLQIIVVLQAVVLAEAVALQVLVELAVLQVKEIAAELEEAQTLAVVAVELRPLDKMETAELRVVQV
jgi:hypothetical protein